MPAGLTCRSGELLPLLPEWEQQWQERISRNARVVARVVGTFIIGQPHRGLRRHHSAQSEENVSEHS